MVPVRLLPDGNAQTATNLDLNNGTFKPLKTYASVQALTGASLRAFFRVKSGASDFWHTSTADFDACYSPVSLLTLNEGRYYWTDGTIPKKATWTMASNAGSLTDGTPDMSYFMGVYTPGQTGTPYFEAINVATDNNVYATVGYVFTYVTAWGEESRPSAPSEGVSSPNGDVKTGQYMQLSQWPITGIPLTRTGIVGIRIYRLNTGGDGAAEYQEITDLNTAALTYRKIVDWNNATGTIAISGQNITGTSTLFGTQVNVNDWILCKGQWFRIATVVSAYGANCATVSVAASPTIAAGATFQYDTPYMFTTINDKDGSNAWIYPDASLGDVIESEEWDEPYDDLVGLRMLSNNCLAAFRRNEIWLSEPGAPFAWPIAYNEYVNSNIVGIGSYGTTLVVCTETMPCVIDCYDPSNMSKQYIFEDQACLWKNAIVSGDNFVIFPSKDGLIMISPNGLQNITKGTEPGKGMFTKKQWQTLLTTSTAYDKEFIACLYDRKYIAFFKGTEHGFIIDLDAMDYRAFSLPSTIDVYDTFIDSKDDKLYLLAYISATAYVISWEQSSSYLTGVWKSKKYSFPEPVIFGAARLIGSFSSGVTLKVYADGVQVGGDITVAVNTPFKFGDSGTELPLAYEWEFYITGTEEVYTAHFASDMDELLHG